MTNHRAITAAFKARGWTVEARREMGGWYCNQDWFPGCDPKGWMDACKQVAAELDLGRYIAVPDGFKVTK